MIRLGIAGIAGRMGREIFEAADVDAAFSIAGGIVRPGTLAEATSAVGSGVPLVDDAAALLPKIDVLVDFTTPQATIALARACAEAGKPIVCGTTGLAPDQMTELEALSANTAIVYSRNMSAGVAAVLAALPPFVSALEGFDVEIVEMHHRHKVDAPSGTAAALAEAVVAARGRSDGGRLLFGRSGVAPREAGDIGIHALRGGGNAGEHTIVFASAGEEVRVSHRAYGRRAFALGALLGARFVASQKPGFYGMRDVLGMAHSG